MSPIKKIWHRAEHPYMKKSVSKPESVDMYEHKRKKRKKGISRENRVHKKFIKVPQHRESPVGREFLAEQRRIPLTREMLTRRHPLAEGSSKHGKPEHGRTPVRITRYSPRHSDQ